jgi:Protein of unknown function (DUF4019)
MRKLLLMIGVGLLVGAAAPHRVFAVTDEAQAIEAAQSFLVLLDNGQTEAAFDATSEIHRSLHIREEWVKLNCYQRGYYGPLVHRTIEKVAPKSSFPKHPDGDFFVIVFESTFLNKERTREIVAVMLEAEEFWRVTDYLCN